MGKAKIPHVRKMHDPQYNRKMGRTGMPKYYCNKTRSSTYRKKDRNGELWSATIQTWGL